MSENNSNQHIDGETQEMLRSFVSEAFDSLDTNEPIVEDLREESNEESVNAIFRVFHTLKGLSGFFEMHVINKVTHIAETLLDIMRKQNQGQTEETITVIYQTFDFLRDLLQRVSVEFTDESGLEEADDIILIIKDAMDKVQNIETPDDNEDVSEDAFEEAESSDEQDLDQEEEVSPPDATEEITVGDTDDFNFDELISDEMLDQYLTNAYELIDTIEKNLMELEKNPDNKDLIRETFQAMHSIKGNSGFMGYSEIEEISMESESILDSVRSGDLEIESNIVTILLSNLETIRNRLENLSSPAQKKEQEKPAQKPKEEPKPEPKLDEEKPKAKEAPKKAEEKKKVEKEKKPKTPEMKTPPTSVPPMMQKKDIRVETTKIDRLFDLVGELITIETMVTNSPDLKGLELPNFSKSANMLNKISRDLQEISMSIRMMPLEGLFNKMKRLVRDVSLKMGKKVNLFVSGQETEMDKNVIDEISDPLVHILRNAIDHGVESPEDRVESGKSEVGNVSLKARYEGNEILIIVEDDGAGINKDKLLEKALSKGILRTDPENMSDKEIFGLIFEPGLSTAQQLTDISGRGVGMDVVKKNLEKLRGSIDVDSKERKGSRITLRIPLTLAIMEAMVIKVGETTFALPIMAIRESFRPEKERVNITMDGLEMVRVRQEVLPIVRIHDLFDIKPKSKDLREGILIIIEARERKVCLFADEIVGQQQAVIKALSDYIGKVSGITGCMIIGDGGIGLILDIESLLDMAQSADYSEIKNNTA
jgi:two-component system, chemotaxis family, sensor kinase CheA